MLNDMEQTALVVTVKEKLLPDFDARYVLRDDCAERQSSVASRFANDDKRISVLVSDFSVIKKLIWVIASASIGSLVTAVFEIMLRG